MELLAGEGGHFVSEVVFAGRRVAWRWGYVEVVAKRNLATSHSWNQPHFRLTRRDRLRVQILGDMRGPESHEAANCRDRVAWLKYARLSRSESDARSATKRANKATLISSSRAISRTSASCTAVN